MDLRNKLPGETFQYLVNIENGQLYNGSGSLITSLTITNITASYVTQSFATQSFAQIIHLESTFLTASNSRLTNSTIDTLTASNARLTNSSVDNFTASYASISSLTSSNSRLTNSTIDTLTASLVQINSNIVFTGSNPSIYLAGNVTASIFTGSFTGSFNTTTDLTLNAHNFFVSGGFIDIDGFVSNARDSLTTTAPVAGEFTHQLNTGTAAAGHGCAIDLTMDTSDGSHRIIGTRLATSWLTASAAGKTGKLTIFQYNSGSFAERFNINPALATFSTQVTANGYTGSHFGTSSWAITARTASMDSAWGYLAYDGTTLVTNTFNATVTRGAVGSYNVLFQTALSSGRYAVVANAHSGSSDASATGSIIWANKQTTTGFTMSCQKVTDFTTLADFTTASFTVSSY